MTFYQRVIVVEGKYVLKEFLPFKWASNQQTYSNRGADNFLSRRFKTLL